MTGVAWALPGPVVGPNIGPAVKIARTIAADAPIATARGNRRRGRVRPHSRRLLAGSKRPCAKAPASQSGTPMDGRQDPRVRGPRRNVAAHRRGAGTPQPARAGRSRPRRGRRLRVASGRPPPHARSQGQPGRDGPAARNRPRARRVDGQYRALRQRPAGEQCPALGRARHGQIIAGQGLPRGNQRVERRQARRGDAQADRDPPRGHREPARPDDADCAACRSA